MGDPLSGYHVGWENDPAPEDPLKDYHPGWETDERQAGAVVTPPPPTFLERAFGQADPYAMAEMLGQGAGVAAGGVVVAASSEGGSLPRALESEQGLGEEVLKA